MNTEAGTKTLVVPTPYGNAMFKHIGTLAPDIEDPQVPADPVIFSEDYIYDDEALQYIRYDHGKTHTQDESSWVYRISDTEAFSAYWFGDVRWKVGDTEMDTPAPYKYLGGGLFGGFFEIDVRKGWKDASVPLNKIREPVRPVIFPENGSDSLLSYLNRKCSMGNIATTWLEGYDWNLEYSDGKPSAVVVKLPWGAYSGTPVVNCLLPSKLADTVVWHAPLSKMEIVDTRWVNGSECNASRTLWGQLTLQQFATIESSALITAELSTDRAEVDGFPQTVTLPFNKTKVIDFYVTNKGVDNDTEATIKVTVRRSFDEVITNSTVMHFILQAPRVPTLSDVARIEPTEPEKPVAVNESSTTGMLVAMVCATAIVIASMAIFAKNKNYRQATKKVVEETKNLAKTVVRPFYARNPGATIAAILGAVVFFGLLLNIKWLPWLRFFPIDLEIPFLWKCQSDWLWVIGVPLSLLAMVGGAWKIVMSRAPPVIQQPLQIFLDQAGKTAVKGAKALSDYFRKDD
jgi:hypothetical protein